MLNVNTKRILGLWLCLILLANCPFISAMPIMMDVYYVDAIEGNDGNSGLAPTSAWQSLSRISSFPFNPGDTILLHRGQTWSGTLSICRTGTSDARITYGAYDRGDRPIIIGENQAVLCGDSDYITVHDLNLQQGDDQTVLVQGSHYFIIEDCDVGWDNSPVGIRATGKWSERPSADHGIIRRCTIDSGLRDPVGDQGEDGIQLTDGANHWQIYDNVIRAWPHSGINMNQIWEDAETAYNKAFRNFIESGGINYMRGFEFFGDDGKVHNNEVFFNFIKNTTIASHINGDHNSVYYNIIDTVINPDGLTNDNAFDLTTWKSGFTGSVNLACHHNRIFNNIVYNTGHAAIQVIGRVNGALLQVHSNQISNNILLESSINAGLIVLTCCDVGANEYSNNLIFTAGASRVVGYNDEAMSVAVFNAFDGNNGDSISGNIQANPRLANIFLADFSLLFDSPAIDSGLEVGLIEDYSGTTMPQGCAPDIGAYEFSPMKCRTVPGDINGDGIVDVNDLLAVLASWGPCPLPCPPTCDADTNDDCAVGVSDLLTVLENWS